MTIITRTVALAVALLCSSLPEHPARAAATFNTCLSNFYYQALMRSDDPGNCYGAANATFVAINLFNTTPYSIYFTLQGNQTNLPPAQGQAAVQVAPTSPSPQANSKNLQSPYLRMCAPPSSEYYDGYKEYWGPCQLGPSAPAGDTPNPSNPYSPYSPQSQAYVLQNGMVLPPFSQIQLTYLPAAATGGTYAGTPDPFQMLQDAQLTLVMAGPGVAQKGAAPVAASAAVGVTFNSSILTDSPITMSNKLFNPSASSGSGNPASLSQPVIYSGGYALFNGAYGGGTGVNYLPSPYMGTTSSAIGGLDNADIALANNISPSQRGGGQFAMVLRGTVGAPSVGGGPPAFNLQIGMNNAAVIGLHQPNSSTVQTSIYPGMWNTQMAVPAMSQ